MNRLMSRLSEFQRSEDTFVSNMKSLQESFAAVVRDPKWSLGPQELAVMNRAMLFLDERCAECESRGEID